MLKNISNTPVAILTSQSSGIGAYLIIGILAVLCIIYPLAKQSYELHKMYESVSVNEQTGYSRRSVTQPNGTTLFQVWETVRSVNKSSFIYSIVKLSTH